MPIVRPGRGGIAAKLVTTLERQGFRGVVTKMTRYLGRKVGFMLHPYEYVQHDVQKHLHNYLRTRRTDIRHITIVGAYLGYELRDMLRRFPQASFTLFEASPRYIERLRSRFEGNPRVKIVHCAIAGREGTIEFRETNINGSGSILEVGPLATSTYGMVQSETYTVPCHTLDHLNLPAIDCLWVDVQGAEAAVLEGATKTLERTRSVFIEVSVHEPLYRGGATMQVLSQVLAKFRLISLGTDATNGTGNAFYLAAY